MHNNSLSRYKLVAFDDASPEVKEIYSDTMKTLQLPFVLNWVKCQGSNALLLKGNWEKLKSTLVLGNVPNVLKQLIIYNVSAKRNCDYCAKAHGIFANSMVGMIDGRIDFDITKNMDSPLIPISFKVAVEVVTKAALHHNTVTDEDFERLYEVGFSHDETIELMAQADLVNMLNTIADLSGIKIDNELIEIQN